MGTRGKSTATIKALNTVPLERIKPPNHLSAKQKKVWRSIVNELPENHFIKADMRSMPEYIKSSPHILELVGILEYFSDDEVLKFLSDAAEQLNEESSVVVNSIEDSHGMRHFLKRAFDFELIYRSPERMMELLQEAGYHDFDLEREPLKIYSIITAHKK